MKFSKVSSLAIVLLSYITAFIVCLVLYKQVMSLTRSFVLAFFILDIIATLIVWATGLIFRNASLYDPYWSVAPAIMAICFTLVAAEFSAVAILFITALVLWGVRLTANWVVDWPGLFHQDWRYTLLKQKNPKIYFITNLFGINLVPTFFVFLAMIPVFVAVLNAQTISVISVAGALICIGAAFLQLVSDSQMRRFRQSGNRGKNMQEGLWKYSRHPNYFGEVSFWWGIYIIQLSVVPQYWYLIICPIMMTLLFVFISVPMMKNKLLASKEGYSQYIKTTSMLIPLPNKKR